MTLPVHISYEDWFNQLAVDRPELTELPVRPSESNWINDAELLLRNPECATLNIPRPEGYFDWRMWAEEFIKAYGGLV